jgi:hypothetical protein
MRSGPADNMRLTAPECYRQPGFQSWEHQDWTEGASFAASENDKARSCLSPNGFLRHIFVPCLLAV